MKIYIYTLLMLLLNSCSLYEQHEPTLSEKQAAFKTVAYDQKLMADFTKYDTLAQILLSNLDTIIRYKNSDNYVTVIGRNGQQSKQLQVENCFMFLNGNDYYDIKKIPHYLSSSVYSLWTLIGKPQLEICKEKSPASLIIKKKFEKRENRILECHFLYWHLNNLDDKDSFDFVKDTALSKDCIYRIGITTDNSGW